MPLKLKLQLIATELRKLTFNNPPTNGHERRPGAILKAALLRERACATKDGNQAASEA